MRGNKIKEKAKVKEQVKVKEEVKGPNASATMGKTVILIGRTGNGKSATGNSILGSSAFKSGFSYTTLTKECEKQQTTLKDGRVLNVVDTPGLFDPSCPQDSVEKEIAKCIEVGKEGIDAVLLLLSIKNRFTPEEASVLDAMQSLFGPEIVNYVIVVFTGGDLLESDEVTIDDFFNDCPQTLKELLRRCNKRMVVFNNKTKSESQKEKQVSELLTQIDKISAANGGHPYSNELFHEAQAMAKQVLIETERAGLQKEENGEFNTELVNRSINEMIEQKLQEATKGLEEQLASERFARRQAEEKRQFLEQEKLRLESEGHYHSLPESEVHYQSLIKLVKQLVKLLSDVFQKSNRNTPRSCAP